jgi:hypothetical protein
MSDDTSDLSQQPVTPRLTAAQVAQALRENFVLVSASAVIGGVILATTFLAAYLGVFDWRLIWFVQYTDIVTIGLIALGVISGSFLFLVNTVMIINNAATSEGRNKRTRIALIVIIGVLALAFNIWGAVKSGQGYFHVIAGFVVLLIGVLILWLVWSYFKAGTMPTPMQFGSLAFLLVIGAGAVGQWLGRSVLEVGQPLEVKIKDAAMTETKLIIELSRHTILLKNRDIYVVPTADITQFHEVAAPYQF